jgi:hypothetical protein
MYVKILCQYTSTRVRNFEMPFSGARMPTVELDAHRERVVGARGMGID